MKIAQYYEGGRVRLGWVRGDSVVPIRFEGDMIDFIEGGGERSRGEEDAVPLHAIRLAPAVSRPTKIMAVGLNYRDHAEESKGKIPEVPLLFAKFPSRIVGPEDPITWDMRVTSKVDYEAELAVIMGKKVRACDEGEALEAVFGYTCGNDVSARDLQFGDGQWVRGKSLDTFCPLGPWIVTRDEIPEPHALPIRCWLNGDLMQDSHTGLMIFTVPRLISFLSRHFTLFPGDVLLTGTPHGVGAFREPSVYLKDGDQVVAEIEGIGRLTNPCRAS
jgi:2-keto-4-pentenoate hydratase/2-oxohepta-3-ene-1,7-dioic acid hydratase in catechol pathway